MDSSNICQIKRPLILLTVFYTCEGISERNEKNNYEECIRLVKLLKRHSFLETSEVPDVVAVWRLVMENCFECCVFNLRLFCVG